MPRGRVLIHVLPIGLTNVKAMLKWVLNLLIISISRENFMVYLNYLIMFVPNFEVFLESLERLLQQLEVDNLRLKPCKCYFGYPK